MGQDRNGQRCRARRPFARKRLAMAALMTLVGGALPARAGAASAVEAIRDHSAAEQSPVGVQMVKAHAGRLSPEIQAGIDGRIDALQSDHNSRAKRPRPPRIYIVPQAPPGALIPPGPDAPQAEKDRFRKQLEEFR